MKKFLEVLVDDNGEMLFSTDFEFSDSIESPPKDLGKEAKLLDHRNRQVMSGLINAVWRDHNLNVSKAIRFLSMAEIISCAQPYEAAELFWSTMMFSFIPHYEKFSTSLKKPYGFDPSKVTRPVGGVFPLGFSPSDIGKPLN